MADTIKTNERELSAKVAQWFDEQIQRNKFPFKSATAEVGVKVEKSTYFGDIIIWENEEAKIAYSYIELKPPYAAKEDMERFRKKALALGVKYAYTWDFQNLKVFEIKGNKLELIDTESQSVLTKLDDWKRGDVQANIKAYIHKICEELLSISSKGKFEKFKPEKHFFIGFIRSTVNELVPIFKNFYTAAHGKKEFKTKIDKYVVQQGITFANESDYYSLIASQSVYGLVTKIIFYLTIQRYFKDLPQLAIEDEPVSDTLQNAFNKASEIDWQAVFMPGEMDEIGLPDGAQTPLNNLFAHLKIYNFGELPEDIIGELFEEIIDPEQRHTLGQYFTKEDLVDLVIGTVVDDYEKYYADPTCGSGTFLIRLYSRFKYLKPGMKHEEILEKIWGIDIGKFPAELSTINLFRQAVSNFNNFPRVLNKSIFDVQRGSSFYFPPPNAGHKAYDKIEVKVPEFHGMVGNFPFIRQELIEKKVPGTKLELTKLLAKEYIGISPNLFDFSKISKAETERIIELNGGINADKEVAKYLKDKTLSLKLSGRADIYAYIYMHCSTLLSRDGNFAIITSNAWLDVEFGTVLKQFFLDHFKIKMIVATWAEPWFDDAAVNTIFTVLEKEEDAKARNQNIINFIKLKKPLKELIKENSLDVFAHQRWKGIDGIVQKMRNAGHKSRPFAKDISAYEDDDMSAKVIMQQDLQEELIKGNTKWGKYLRAPNVFFEIMGKFSDKFVPLKSTANIKFGIKTGINEFFYLEIIGEEKKGKTPCRNDRGWEGEIETEYLKKIIKSPKESSAITIDDDKLKYFIFMCNESIAELKKQNHSGALHYIQWGEKQRNQADVPYPKISSVSGRKNWYSLNKEQYADYIFPCGYGDSFKVFDNDKKILTDKRLYEIYSDSDILPFLNSTLFALFIETNSRVGLGDGLLDLTVYEVEDLLVPQPELLQSENIKKAFDKIRKRKILSIFKEVKQKDRIALDTAVLEALGLDPKEYLPKIYEGLTTMVRERLELPKMRKKQQKQKVKISYDQVKESVEKECIGEGIKDFPEAFFTYGDMGNSYESLEFEIYNTSGLPLHIDKFIGNFTLKDEKGDEIFVTNSEAKAKFAVIMSKRKKYSFKIPEDEKIVEQLILNYYTYVAQLKESILTNANQKLHNWAAAEKMTEEIMNEYGISD